MNMRPGSVKPGPVRRYVFDLPVLTRGLLFLRSLMSKGHFASKIGPCSSAGTHCQSSHKVEDLQSTTRDPNMCVALWITRAISYPRHDKWDCHRTAAPLTPWHHPNVDNCRHIWQSHGVSGYGFIWCPRPATRSTAAPAWRSPASCMPPAACGTGRSPTGPSVSHRVDPVDCHKTPRKMDHK